MMFLLDEKKSSIFSRPTHIISVVLSGTVRATKMSIIYVYAFGMSEGKGTKMLGGANKKTADSIQISCACGIPALMRINVLQRLTPLPTSMIVFSMSVMYFCPSCV